MPLILRLISESGSSKTWILWSFQIAWILISFPHDFHRSLILGLITMSLIIHKGSLMSLIRPFGSCWSIYGIIMNESMGMRLITDQCLDLPFPSMIAILVLIRFRPNKPPPAMFVLAKSDQSIRHRRVCLIHLLMLLLLLFHNPSTRRPNLFFFYLLTPPPPICQPLLIL